MKLLNTEPVLIESAKAAQIAATLTTALDSWTYNIEASDKDGLSFIKVVDKNGEFVAYWSAE